MPKNHNFPDRVIGVLTGLPEESVKKMRYENGITAAFKMVDTCAAEFEAATPYYYSCFGSENEAAKTNPARFAQFAVRVFDAAENFYDREATAESAGFVVIRLLYGSFCSLPDSREQPLGHAVYEIHIFCIGKINFYDREATAEKGIEAWEDWCRSIGMPASLTELGIAEAKSVMRPVPVRPL